MSATSAALAKAAPNQFFTWQNDHWSPNGFVSVDTQGSMPWEKFGMGQAPDTSSTLVLISAMWQSRLVWAALGVLAGAVGTVALARNGLVPPALVKAQV